MNKLPYEVANYGLLRRDGYNFVDKTHFMPGLEELGTRYLFFLYPRRFGKSLFLSILKHYYDIRMKEHFEELFGDAWIGKDPTPLRNRVAILKFDSSGIPVHDDLLQTGHPFNRNIKRSVVSFFNRCSEIYSEIEDVRDIVLGEEMTADIVDNLVKTLAGIGVSYYLLIDEYANNYWFHQLKDERLYNTDMVMCIVDSYIAFGGIPPKSIAQCIRTDYEKLKFLMIENNRLNGNFNILQEMVDTEQIEGYLVNAFSIENLIDSHKFVSHLYYLGLITIRNYYPGGFYEFMIPSVAVSTLLWGYVREAVSKIYSDLRIDIKLLGEMFRSLAFEGEWKPLFEYLLEEFYRIMSSRDFIWKEDGVKRMQEEEQIRKYAERLENKVPGYDRDKGLPKLEKIVLIISSKRVGWMVEVE